MRRILVLLTLLFAARAHGSPQSAVLKALQDVKKLAPDQQQNSLYLTLYAIPEDERRTFYRLLTLHVNNLSREAEITAPAILDNTLIRVDIRDFGWKKATIDLLANVDPYFHVKLRNETVLIPTAPVVTPVTVPAPGSRAKALRDVPAFREDDPTQKRGDIGQGDDFEVVKADKEGKKLLLKTGGAGNVWVNASDFTALGATVAVSVTPVQPKADKPQQTVTAAAPGLPTKEITELIALTQSQAPILRADWFFLQTARQVDRNNQAGNSYYEFLGIKNEKDIEELAGLDRKVAEKLRRELAAIIPKSTVTLHNRQIFAIQDGYWESRDTDSNADNKNAVRQLDKDYKFIAKEVYFRLPNGLWGLAAVNAVNGELAASVPDSIASDNQSTSTDHRVIAPISCLRCHQEGLRPLDDYARKFFERRSGAVLTSLDYDTLKRLRQLYLGPLQDRYEDDQRFYARVLMRTTGWEPKEVARLYKNAWRQWGEDDVTGKQFAAELGVSHEDMLKAFKVYAAANPLKQIDPILLGYLKIPEFTARREMIEEAFVLAQEAVVFYGKQQKKEP